MTDNAKALEQKIWRLVKAGRLQDAASACDELNQAFPEYDSGWNTSSRVAVSLNEPVIALRAVQQALLISPGKPEWLLQKMACLAVYGDLDAANLIADEIASYAFDTAYHASSCAVILNRLERFEDSERHYRRAAELNPDNPGFQFNLATAQRLLGNVDGALANLDEVIASNPVDFDAQLMRSSLREQSPTDNNLDSLHHALEQLPAEHPGRVQLLYALAKELDDLQRYSESFDCLQQGASERRSRTSYDADQDLRAMEAIQKQFDTELFASGEEGFINAEAIFVIGLPRSGVALVDRILSQHAVVRSIGESAGFGLAIVEQIEKESGQPVADTVEMIGKARSVDFAAVGEAYVASCRPAGKANAHFVNKLPNNFMYAGAIHLALPKAKIIVVERDPMDACYTMFATSFPGVHPYSCDLRELANFIVAYRRLMQHWTDVMPNAIHAVRYEDLLADSRPVVENLLEYCDLSFDENCLNFQPVAERAARTAGAKERFARRKRAIDHWKHYREQLQPALEIIEDAGYG